MLPSTATAIPSLVRPRTPRFRCIFAQLCRFTSLPARFNNVTKKTVEFNGSIKRPRLPPGISLPLLPHSFNIPLQPGHRSIPP